ncbi:MAG: hypothetical protein ACI943_000577, partial [Gammaproteobacteria bacterium]
TNWEEANREIRANSSTQKAFVKRFYRWFNAFRLMKYLHYSRDYFHPNLTVSVAAQSALSSRDLLGKSSKNIAELVVKYRELEYGDEPIQQEQ